MTGLNWNEERKNEYARQEYGDLNFQIKNIKHKKKVHNPIILFIYLFVCRNATIKEFGWFIFCVSVAILYHWNMV